MMGVFAVVFLSIVVVAVMVLAVIICAAGGKQMPCVRLVPAQTQLTRKWARAMFFNRLISLEELNHFYSILPEDLPGDTKLPK
jgi:hypothetical protein